MIYTEADKKEILDSFARHGEDGEAAAIFEVFPLFRAIAEQAKRTEALQAAILFFFEAGRIYGRKDTHESDTYTTRRGNGNVFYSRGQREAETAR